MKTIISIFLISILALTSGNYTHSGAQDDGARWERLGSRKVNFGLDRDVIRVTAKEGTFTKLKFKVTGGNLNMHRIVVVYGNGARDEIEVRHKFRRGSATRIVDLRGNKRVIRKITFWYDTKNLSRRRATLHVFGRH